MSFSARDARRTSRSSSRRSFCASRVNIRAAAMSGRRSGRRQKGLGASGSKPRDPGRRDRCARGRRSPS
jgi:hypothetical protein